jgi:hypothetical protein
MLTTLESVIHAELGWTWRDHVGTAPIVDSNHHQFSKRLSDGEAAGQANAIWHVEDQKLLAGQALMLRLDLLEQPLFGDIVTIPMAKIKVIEIVHKDSSETGILVVGGAPAAPWYAPFGAASHTIKVMPGSPLLLANAGTGWDVGINSYALQIQAIGGAATFDIAILGTLLHSYSS